MRGRKLFNIARPIIRGFILIFTVCPRFLRVFIWDMISPYSQIIFVGFRYVLLKTMIKKCGKNVMIGKNVIIKNWKNLEVGDNSSINANCYIDGIGGIIIGNDVSIGHGTSILSFDHTWQDANLPIRENELSLKPIYIEDNVWIGAGCKILEGVKIKRRSVVAANAVVTKDLMGNMLHAGIPAKSVKQL
jgi:acetyltransferase-like isoleucine patch superfamily enzyme